MTLSLNHMEQLARQELERNQREPDPILLGERIDGQVIRLSTGKSDIPLALARISDLAANSPSFVRCGFVFTTWLVDPKEISQGDQTAMSVGNFNPAKHKHRFTAVLLATVDATGIQLGALRYDVDRTKSPGSAGYISNLTPFPMPQQNSDWFRPIHKAFLSKSLTPAP